MQTYPLFSMSTSKYVYFFFFIAFSMFCSNSLKLQVTRELVVKHHNWFCGNIAMFWSAIESVASNVIKEIKPTAPPV